MYAIASSLRHNFSITDVQLVNCNVSSEELLTFFEGLKGAEALRSLGIEIRQVPVSHAADISQNAIMSTSVLEGKFKDSPCLQEIFYSESNLSERKVLKRPAGSRSHFLFPLSSFAAAQRDVCRRLWHYRKPLHWPRKQQRVSWCSQPLNRMGQPGRFAPVFGLVFPANSETSPRGNETIVHSLFC